MIYLPKWVLFLIVMFIVIPEIILEYFGFNSNNMNDFHYLAVWGAIIVIMYFTIRVLKFYIIDFLIKLIRLYQKTFSPDHGIFKHNYPAGYCKFHPTCSDYAIQSLRKYGLIKGGLKAIWRILRCNPLSKGGIDTLK